MDSYMDSEWVQTWIQNAFVYGFTMDSEWIHTWIHTLSWIQNGFIHGFILGFGLDSRRDSEWIQEKAVRVACWDNLHLGCILWGLEGLGGG